MKLDVFKAQKNLRALGKVATVFRGYNAIPKTIEETTEGEYKLIRTPDVEDNQLIVDSIQTVDINASINEEQYLVQPGDIIISARGQHTKVAVIPEVSGKYILTQSFIGIRPNIELVNLYFLKAFFESPIGQYLIQQSMSGSTIPVISPKLLNELNIPLPSMQEQKQIGGDYRKAMERYRDTIIQARKDLEINQLDTYNAMGIGKIFEIKTDK